MEQKIKLAKCPKCKSDDYMVLFVEEYSYNYSYNYGYDYVSALSKVCCSECGEQFWVKERYRFIGSEIVKKF